MLLRLSRKGFEEVDPDFEKFLSWYSITGQTRIPLADFSLTKKLPSTLQKAGVSRSSTEGFAITAVQGC